MSTPDVTPIQKLGTALLALEGAAFGLARAFGVDVTDAQALAIGIFSTAFIGFLVAADAVIRHGRAKVAAAKVEADAKLALAAPAPPTRLAPKPRKRG